MKRLLIMTLLCPLLSMCQPLTIKGKIVNEQNEPVAGATITIKMTGDQKPPVLLSNEDGEFVITGLKILDTLVVSAIGYNTAFEVYDHTTLRNQVIITLTKKANTLEEVVINTGYQTVPRERATGSFETIGKEQLNLQTGTDIIGRLRGTSSILFDDNSLRPPLTIRGLSTIYGEKSPLIILDNFPYNGDLNNINPNDVESITILKDAAAASIWGTKAGNGVIVITTKKGSYSQPMKIELSSNMTWQQIPDFSKMETISSSDFIDVEQFLFDQQYRFSDTLSNTRPAFSPVYEILFKKRKGLITDAEANEQINALRSINIWDQFADHFYQPAMNSQHALNIRGGTANTGYYFSAGFDQNHGSLDNIYNRLTLKSDNTFRLNRNFRFNTTLMYNQNTQRSGRPTHSSLVRDLYPYSSFVDPDGNPLGFTRVLRQTYIDTAGAGLLFDWNYYPLDDYKHNQTTINTRNLLSAFGFNYNFYKFLSLDVKYQYQKQELELTKWQDEQSFFTRDLVNRFTQVNWANGTVKYNIPLGGIMDKTISNLTGHYFRSSLSFQPTIGDGVLSGLAGFELSQNKTDGYGTRWYGHDPNTMTTASVDFINPYRDYAYGLNRFIPFVSSIDMNVHRYVSFFGNAAYHFKQKYTLSASARRDASNMFGVTTNNKWKPLWSAGASWQISSEEFYKLNWLPILKLRLTYGYNGNMDPNGTAVTTIRYTGLTAQYTNYIYASPVEFANPNLRWETSGILNIGLDFSNYNDRVSGSIEYYRKKGTDLFGNTPMDYTLLPATVRTINIASMKGRGIDLVLNTRNIQGAFSWTSNLIFSYAANTVTKYYPRTTRGRDHISQGTSITAYEGYPVYSILSYQWAGLDSLGNPVGIIDKQASTNYSSILGTATQFQDLVFSGPGLPPYYGSLSNSFSFKGFSLTASLIYKFGYYFRKSSVGYSGLASDMVHSDYEKRWLQPGDELHTQVPSFVYPFNGNRDAFYLNSEVLVRKGDHIRLQFVNLSYQWPGKPGTRNPVSSARIFLTASNLGLVWTANKEGIDPDYGNDLPTPLSFACGINLTLK